ncbi:hypothetical protein BHE74_00033289, partial [Ensete ventricosum]
WKHGFTKKYDGYNVAHKVEFRSIFCAPSRRFKILAIPNILGLGKPYVHGFTKKRDNHKHCTKLSFDRFFRFFMHRLKKIQTIPNVIALAQKFKILAIPNVLAHEKSYEHDFAKKYDGHKLCVKSSFDWFFVHHLGNSKY